MPETKDTKTNVSDAEARPSEVAAPCDCSVRGDAERMVRRWTGRNPDLEMHIREGHMPLEDICELAINTWLAYNGIRAPNAHLTGPNGPGGSYD